MKKSPCLSLILFAFGIPVFGFPVAVLIASMSVPSPSSVPWISADQMNVFSLMMFLGAVMIGFGIYFGVKAFSVKKLG